MPLEPQLQSYIKRADELEEVSPVSAFYCISYVIDELSELYRANKNDREIKNTLVQLLDRAEALKEARGPFELSDFVAFAQCLMDAAEADEDHQSAFYRFFIVGKLFDVVVHFSDSEEHAKAKRYAQFMSLKRRKQHLGEVAPESQPSVEGSSSNGAEENERRLDAKGESDESGDEEPKSVAPTRAPLVNSGSPELQEEAIKHAKSAVSALSFEDFGTAAAHLRAALDVLGRMGF